MEDANTNDFEGLRYYRKGLEQADGQSKDAAGKHQFVSMSKKSMMFGYGRHACPGRFFAGNEIKLILAKILQDFDLKLEGDERYPNMKFESSVSHHAALQSCDANRKLQNGPDTNRKVLLKRRNQT